MPGQDELATFLKDALGRGLPRPEIRDALTSAGWRPEQIAAAMARYAEVPFPLPVPRPRAYLSPRETFMYLVLFSALYTSAYQLGSLILDLINQAYPDPVESSSYEYARVAMRWSIAYLVVAFPVFLFMASIINRDVGRDPSKHASPVRKWLTYLTLFVAAIALIGDVTTLVYNALGGELTTRFVLKVLTVGMIAGTGFGYYLRDIRQDEREGAA